jgi:predicted aspartyl protease
MERSMETATMGKVIVTAKLQNLKDLENAHDGLIAPDQVRTLDVTDALIDTGASGLLLSKPLIEKLGLRPLRMRPSRTITGPVALQIYSAVRLTIQGRECISEVTEIAENLPVLVGQVPLELLDWVVDCKGHRLIGNPEHGGEHMIDAF